MSYSVLTAKIVGAHYMADLVAETADRAWRGSHGKDKNWRLEYYGPLVRSPVGSCIFSVIEYNDEVYGRGKAPCALLAVLPLDEFAAKLHLNGTLHQHDITLRNIQLSRRRQERTYHYVQSVWRDPVFRNSLQLKRLMFQELYRLLEEQKCGRNNHGFTVFAEAFSSRALQLAENFELRPNGKVSPTGASVVEISYDPSVAGGHNPMRKWHERIQRLGLERQAA